MIVVGVYLEQQPESAYNTVHLEHLPRVGDTLRMSGYSWPIVAVEHDAGSASFRTRIVVRDVRPF